MTQDQAKIKRKKKEEIEELNQRNFTKRGKKKTHKRGRKLTITGEEGHILKRTLGA